MAYTASALSFMLEGLDRPVILTGSQLPIGVLRTDGKENLMDGQPYLTAEGALVMEVNALIPHITGTRTQYDDKVNVLRIETE